MHAGVYVRISKDPAGLRAGVERQREDSLREVERRGWHPVVFEDNDVSAYAGKPRPGYEAMLEAVQKGEVGAIVAWAPDRFTRHLRELETLITTVEAAGCQVVTVQAGDWDLTTPEGRFMARQLGLLARLESEKMAARHQRAKLGEAEAGQPHKGGHRPWGFEEDRITHRPDEVAAIRDAVVRLLDGESLTSVARQAGRSPDGLKRSLRSPRMIGVRRHRDKEYPAAWEPVLDRDTWTAVRAVLDSRKRRDREPGGTRARGTLLAGFLFCGLCGGRCSGSGKDYACGTCKRLRRLQRHVDAQVRDFVLERAEVTVRAADIDPALLAAVGGFEARLADCRAMWAAGEISKQEFLDIRGQLSSGLTEAQDRLADATAISWGPWLDLDVALEHGEQAAEAALWWEQADLRKQRGLVEQHVERVVIDRADRKAPAAGVHIVPKAKIVTP